MTWLQRPMFEASSSVDYVNSAPAELRRWMVFGHGCLSACPIDKYCARSAASAAFYSYYSGHLISASFKTLIVLAQTSLATASVLMTVPNGLLHSLPSCGPVHFQIAAAEDPLRSEHDLLSSGNANNIEFEECYMRLCDQHD